MSQFDLLRLRSPKGFEEQPTKKMSIDDILFDSNVRTFDLSI